MKKLLIILGIFFLGVNSAWGLQIVYPKTNPAKINAPSTFFIGSASTDEIVKINGQIVDLSAIGAFAYMLPLEYGINNFKIESNSDLINFVIERAQPSAAPLNMSTLIEYPNVLFSVKKDGASLRSTPVNSGINRLSQLDAGINLLVNGEKGDFFRVDLGQNLSGWILKTDVEQSVAEYKTQQFKNFKIEEDKKNCFYKIELTDKVPFAIKEENGLKIQLFNLQNCSDDIYNLDVPIPKLFGYESYYDGNTFVLKLKKIPQINPQTPLKDLIIAVDAGHGGCENGAIGGRGDKEKDINLAIAKNLQAELQKRGAKVVMTRQEDVQVSLSDRIKKAHDENSDLLISIHANALPDGQNPLLNRGTSVYYYHNQSKNLAENILNSMTTQLGTKNDKVRQGSLALVRPTFCPSVLIEVAYMINPDDYALLLDKNFQVNCAKSIADGVEKYILSF